MDVPGRVKEIIKDFELYSAFNAYQISQKSQVVDSDIATELRKIKKNFRRKSKENGDDSLEFAVRGILNNATDREIQRHGVKQRALWNGKTLLKLAKKGRSPAEIGRVIGFGEHRVANIIENMKIKEKV